MNPLDLQSWLDQNPAVAADPGGLRDGHAAHLGGVNGRAANGHAGGRRDSGRDRRLARAIAYVDKIGAAVAGRGGHDETFDVACALVKGFDLSVDDARPILRGFSQRCTPPWSDAEIEHKLADADRKPDDKPRGYLFDRPDPDADRDARADRPGGPDAGRDDAPAFEFSDMGNAHRLLHLHANRIRFCKPYGDWLIFDGLRWVPDDRLQIESFAQDIPGQVLAEIPPTNNDEAIKAFRKWSLASQSKDRLMSAISAARNHVSVIPEELDRDVWLLNVSNGTIDLRTGDFRGHRSSDLITKLAPVAYDPAAQCPNWRRFVSEIMKNDPELVDYLQRAIGYAITGVIRQHVFFCCYGTGSNGKTTMFKTLHNILGDYGNEIDSDILLSQSSAQHPTGLTELEGRRLVISEETDDTRRLAEALVKKLTGGSSTISARKMHKDFYKFRATHHLFLATNHKPEIRGTDPAIWRRIKLLPFEVSFDPTVAGGRTPDFHLDEKLAGEHPGILNWMLEGCRAWQERGLVEPPAILAATRGYRDEMDTLGWFLEERCRSDEDHKVVLSVVYGEYVAWCAHSNIMPTGIRRFSSQLADRGHETKKSHSVVYKLGLRLKTDYERQAESSGVADEPAWMDAPAY